MKIGIISDTHGYLDPKVFDYFKEVDEIWHAGDVGSLEVVDALRKFKPLRIVYGNIDDTKMRMETAEFLRFKAGKKVVLITHIAGRPGNYSKPLYEELAENGAPDILVCGHSHILLVQMDKRYNMLWMNPGAFGNKGFHQVRTLLRFEINADKIENLEVIERKR